MPLPPRGNPQRPLAQTANAAKVLGVIFAIFCTLLMLLILLTASPGVVPVMAILVFYGVPGAGFLVLASFIKKRQKWAVITAIVLASLTAALVLFGVGSMLVGLYLGGGASVAIGPTVFMLCLMAISILLVIYASLTLRRWNELVEFQPGFTPIMAAPVAPLPAQPAAQEGEQAV
jgi:hypothetical protein